MLAFRRISSVSALLLTTATTVATVAARAEPVNLTDSDLRRMLPGAVIELDTPIGVRLPVTFTGDGLMNGEAGRLEPYLGSARDRGRWWVSDDKLCQKWFRWLDAKPRCAKISRTGNRIAWREDNGETGTATIVAEARDSQQKPIAANTAPMMAGLVQAVPEQPAAKDTISTSRARSSAPASTAATPQDGQPTTRFASPALAVAARPVPNHRPARPVTAAAPSRTLPTPTPRRVVVQAPRSFNPPIPLPARPMAEVAEVAEAPPAPFTRALVRSGGTFRVRGVMNNDVLNVRRGPSEQHAVVAGLQPGSGNIRIVGRCIEAWCQVSTPRAAGWVNALYLAPERITRRYRFEPFRHGLGGPFKSGS